VKHNISVDETNEYLAQLGHEMRSPLHSILGFTHMLSETCQEEAANSWLRNIKIASKHLLDLVNDIIDVNRLSTQLIEIADEQVDIKTLTFDIISSFQPQSEINQLHLDCVIDPNCPQFWRGDKRKLKQILINIISNAIKFTPPNGTIAVDISEVSNKLRMAVKDTGVGMDEETLTHLFQPYFHSRSRINQQGTGLGLTITRRLIDLMHGEILISSQPNEGSEFIVILPLKKDNAAPPISFDSTPEQLTETAHILLVDDDPLHHEVLIGMVKNLPIVVHSAFSFEQTLIVCPEIKPQIILCDYRLPDGDGLSLARTLRHCNNHMTEIHRISIAMLTAHRGADLQEALNDGTLDAVLYKPLEVSSLIKLIATHQSPLSQTILAATAQEIENKLSSPDYLQGLLPEFYRELKAGIDECERHLKTQNYKALSNTAHRLKGQAMIFHHHRFWQQFEALETFTQAQNHSMAVGVLNQILQTYQEERNHL
jgi:CheY-like chemotaxis protein/anti-sigma regulatory factor (Ser/Thr protein kinase)